jgi:DNA-binding transcriptional regulator GbsR (MarR family)
MSYSAGADTQEDLDEEEVEEEAEEALRSLQDVLHITDDFSRLGLDDTEG